MADKSNKLTTNVPGRFYVDDSCTDCDVCRNVAPQFFARDDAIGMSLVWRQPVTAGEIALAEEAMASCPTESIGSDG
jgi:ferredoxin